MDKNRETIVSIGLIIGAGVVLILFILLLVFCR